MRTTPVLFWNLLIACSLAGCQESKPDLVAVRGQVTLTDKPVVGFVVSFRPIGATDGHGSLGETDDQGKFELSAVRGGKGAYAGMYKVHFYPAPKPKDLEDPANVVATGNPGSMPGIYINPNQYPLVAEVPLEACFVEIKLAQSANESQVTTTLEAEHPQE